MDAQSPLNGSLPTQNQRFHPSMPPPDPMQTSFKLDEGYSEETRSQAESDTALRSVFPPGDMVMDTGLPSWITILSEADRSELAYTILRTLRTSSMAAIVERLHPVLHMDPMAYLPPEIAFEIFSYLPPQALLTASEISKTWRERALDSRLWRGLYGKEGWTAEKREIRKFEEGPVDSPPPCKRQAVASNRVLRTTRMRLRPEPNPSGLFGGGGGGGGDENMESPSISPIATGQSAAPAELGRQLGPVGAGQAGPDRHPAGSGDTEVDAEMEDADSAASGAGVAVSPVKMDTAAPPPAQTTQLTLPNQRKLNWQHLYKQRKRLEDNWSAGRCATFRLPHPDHEDEGHKECVYTIQYSGKYLVSGSRDKSLRIWNLDTRRLVKAPLYGHGGSVLCLQFDPSEEEDLIVSGSSDTDVIVWRFSTGEKIRKIKSAHRESVLNLRFDKRYLITCSKDKTINVWNRRLLEASDKVFPLGAKAESAGLPTVFPAYILNMAANHSLGAEARLASRNRLPPLAPFTLLMTLNGHQAAVNAIQVHGDQVVSASGDRTIKVWNLQNGVCLRTIPGHNKGIACVQYDGRRIVSGSSDNTVKIFDRNTGAEVACLLGHQDLVRTVQAGFGDLPGSEEEERAEAKAIDEDYFRAIITGMIEEEAPAQATKKIGNAGGRAPGDISTYGAQLPPGGGGSRWGRIVSGSYDETIIIWKRDSEGKWVVGRRLRHEDTTRTSRPTRAAVAAAAAGAAVPATAPHHHHQNGPAQTLPQVALTTQLIQLQSQLTQAGHYHTVLQTQIAQAQAQLQAHLQQGGLQQQPQQQQPPTGMPPGLNPTAAPFHHSLPHLEQQLAAQQQAHALLIDAATHWQSAVPYPALPPAMIAQATGQPAPPAPPHEPAPLMTQAQLQAQPPPQAQQPQPPPPAAVPPPPSPVQPAAAPSPGAAPAAIPVPAPHAHGHGHGHGHGGHNNHAPQNGGNARVFKLQFDARRVICCSQDPRIMGWDFANGDAEIEEASKFFRGLG